MLAFDLTRRRVCGAENRIAVLPHPPYGGKGNFSNATRDRSPYGLRLYFGLTCCVLWAKIRHVGCNRAVRGRSSVLRDCGLSRSFSPSAPVYLNSGLFHEEKPRYRPVAIASHKAKQPAKAGCSGRGDAIRKERERRKSVFWVICSACRVTQDAKPRYRLVAIASHKAKQPAKAGCSGRGDAIRKERERRKSVFWVICSACRVTQDAKPRYRLVAIASHKAKQPAKAGCSGRGDAIRKERERRKSVFWVICSACRVTQDAKPRYRLVAIASHKAKQPAKAVVPAEGARFVRSGSDGRACFESSVLRAESRRTQNRVTDLLQIASHKAKQPAKAGCSGRGDAIRTRNRRFWRPLLYR